VLEFLTFVTLLLVVWLLVLSAMVGTGLWALGRHNRVSPAKGGSAPIPWLWSPTSSARLHRRLRTAVSWVERPGVAGAHDAARDGLVDQAVRLDAALVNLSRAPRRHTKPQRNAIRRDVTELERLAVRLHAMRRPADVPTTGWTTGHGDPLADLRLHIELLEHAHDELADVERHAGLRDAPAMPDPVIATSRPAPARPVTARTTPSAGPGTTQPGTPPSPAPEPRPRPGI